MAKIVVVTSGKGGVGKTTTSAAFSSGLALDDVDEVVHHAALTPHDEIEVAQADIKVDHGGLVAAQGEAGGKGGAGGGLAHATLAGGHDDDFCHV